MPKRITIIVAVDINGGFGKDGKLPWHYKEDLQFFKRQTAGKVCVMGRATYDEINSISNNATEVLPGRQSYVLSSTLTSLPNATVVPSINDIPHDDIMVIGGKRVYDEAIKYANTVLLTYIDKAFDCDVFFDINTIQQHFTHVDNFPSITDELTFMVFKRYETKRISPEDVKRDICWG